MKVIIYRYSHFLGSTWIPGDGLLSVFVLSFANLQVFFCNFLIFDFCIIITNVFLQVPFAADC